MTTKIWNETDGAYGTAADWSPGGTPRAGDVAIIRGGTVTLVDTTLDGVALQLQSPNPVTPTLDVRNSTFTASTSVAITAGVTDAVMRIAGTVENQGKITLTSTGQGISTVLLPGDISAAIFKNSGSVTIDSGAQVVIRSSTFNTGFVNSGSVTVLNSAAITRVAYFQVGVLGNGTINIGNNSLLEFGQDVAAGQSIVFSNGTATVQLDAPGQFAGRFVGFGGLDKIVFGGASYDAVNYTTIDANSGRLVLSQHGVTIDAFTYVGDYAQNSFAISTSVNTGLAAITATGAAPQRVAFTDTTTGVSSGDAATYYSGPVNYLQWQYIWNSADGVAIAGQSDNMFLHGGSGADAISAHGGSNVIDGGAGSNFLVGATGADGGADTFYVDGRGGAVTWSSIVNFHHGDAATIFGFNDTSTLPAFTADGATGYTGATIHSELSGAGSGVNGSLTFVGLSVADAQSKLTVQTGHFGTAGQADYLGYLYIAYTG